MTRIPTTETAPLNRPTLDLSIVVPVFNERESLPELIDELRVACTKVGDRYEVIFVNDGSTDGSAEILDRAAAQDPHLRVVHFRRNFGKSSALSAAFDRIRGNVVVTMDADLQDNPSSLAEFIATIGQGADLVCGWKRDRHDPIGKTFPSRIFNSIVRASTGVKVHDINCGFKAFTADCVREFRVYGGFHRFLPVLAAARGYRVEELVVPHRARKYGTTKYGTRRFFHGIADLLTLLLVTRYRLSPLHLFGKLGSFLGVCGFGILLYLTILWFCGIPIGHRPMLTLGALLLIVGSLFLGIGLLGELIVHMTVTEKEIFSVRAETGIAPTFMRSAIPNRLTSPIPDDAEDSKNAIPALTSKF